MYAGGMHSHVSISLEGTGAYAYTGNIPGFVLNGGTIQSHEGQYEIRPMIQQGESPLYNTSIPNMGGLGVAFVPMMANVPMMTTAGPTLVPVPMAMPVAAPAPMAAPIPVPVPAAPVITPAPSVEQILPSSKLPAAQTIENFQGSFALANLPTAIDFSQMMPSVELARPYIEAFQNAFSSASLPMSVPEFSQVISSSELAVPVTFSDFSDLRPYANLPGELFVGANSGVTLSRPLTVQDFGSLRPLSYLPVAVAPKVFAPLAPVSTLPGRALPSFAEVVLSVQIPMPFTTENFQGMITENKLPEEYFIGINSEGTLPVPVGMIFSETSPGLYVLPVMPSKKFAGVEPVMNLPVPSRPLVFEENVSVDRVKLMFPGGAVIVPTYGLGIPLGVEKPLMEPEIQTEQTE
jgi:hypothetical protein